MNNETQLYRAMRAIWNGDRSLTLDEVNAALYAAFQDIQTLQAEVVQLREERRRDQIQAFDE